MRRSRWLAGLLALTLVLTLLPGIAFGAGPRVPFLDVIGGAYEEPVQALWQIGVVSGTSDKTYSPKDPVTRAQMAALLVRALKLSDTAKQSSFAPKFTDVPTTFWGFSEVMMAERLGIVKGMTATEFAPGDPVTYAQATVMALRALGYDDGTMVFPTGYVLLASELKLQQGLKWELNAPMNRGEVAVLLANTVFKVSHKQYGETLSQKYFRYAVGAEIAPASDMLVAGTTQLEAVGKDAYGNSVVGTIAQWRIISGSGTLTANGQLTANSGTVTVEATVGDNKSTRTYKILSGLAITPDTGTVKPGEALNLRAVSSQDRNQEITGVTWSVVSGPAQINQSGRLSVTGSGTVTVQAAIGSLKATATFGSATGLQIVSPVTYVAAGDTVQMTVKQPDGTPFTGPVQWSVDGAGTITQDGKFTAATGSGTPTIKVKAGDLVATLPMKVVHRLTVEPGPTVSVVKSKTQQFMAKGVTTSGEMVDVPITWSQTGKNGILGADGLFVATTAGSGQVTASFGKLQQSVSVSVSGDPYMIQLTSSRSSAPANGRSVITLTATLKDINGIVVATETPVSFLLSDATKGTLNESTVKTVAGVATATFTPSTNVGTFRVTAAATDLAVIAGFVDLSTTQPVPSKIRLTASPNPVASAANSRATISASLVDAEGYEIMNTTGTTQAVTLSFTNTTAASLTNSVIYISPNSFRGQVDFNAGNPGDTIIHGTSNWPVESVTIRTMLAGPAAKIAIRPGIVDTKADGSTEMLVYAEVQDANGVTRTQDYGIPITLSAATEDGLTTLPASIMSTQSGVAAFRIRSTKAGKFTFTASAGNLLAGTAVASFLPGAAAGLKLSALPIAEMAADGTSTVKLRAEIVDANGNKVPTATGNVTFTRISNTNATALPAATMVPAVGGVAEITLTSTVYPGEDTFKATLAGVADSELLKVKTRITGVPSKVVGEITTASTNVGNRLMVKVYVQDSLNQTVTSASNRVVRLVPNSPTAQVTGSGITEGGVAIFYVTDTKAGAVNLSITSEGLASDNSKALQFNAGSAAKVALKLTSPELSVDAGASYVQLSAEVEDVYGNRVYQAIPVSITTDRMDVITLSSTQLYTGNMVLVRSTSLPGTATISGTASIPVIPVTISTFIPGAPARVRVDSATTGPAGTSLTFKVRVIDTNGHVLTSIHTGGVASAIGVTLYGSGGNTHTITNNNLYLLGSFQGNGVTNGSAGVQSGVATFTYTNMKAESVTVTPIFYYNGVQLPADTGVVTTTAGTAAKLTVRPVRTGLSSAGGDTTLVEAVLTDAYDNPVASAEPDTFTFSLSTNAYVATGDPLTLNTTNGKTAVQVTSKSHDVGGSTTITVTSAKTGMTGTATIVTDRPPAAPIIYVTDATGMDTVVGGGEMAARVVVTVEARNSAQTVVAYVNGIQVNLFTVAGGTVPANTIAPGQTTLVGYINRSDLGGLGPKSIRIVVQNAVAPGPMSNTQTITVQ